MTTDVNVLVGKDKKELGKQLENNMFYVLPMDA